MRKKTSPPSSPPRAHDESGPRASREAARGRRSAAGHRHFCGGRGAGFGLSLPLRLPTRPMATAMSRLGGMGFSRNASASERKARVYTASMTRAVVRMTGRARGDPARRGEQIQAAHVREIEVGKHEIPVLIGDPLHGDDRVSHLGYLEARALAEHVPDKRAAAGSSSTTRILPRLTAAVLSIPAACWARVAAVCSARLLGRLRVRAKPEPVIGHRAR